MIKRLIRALFQWAHRSDGAQEVPFAVNAYREDEAEGFTISYRTVSNGAILNISAYASRKGQHFTTTRVVTAGANPHDEIAAIIAEMRLLK